MAPVKLTIVALFLCIFTFMKIVPTIAGIHEVERKLVDSHKYDPRWHVVGRVIREQFRPLYNLEEEFECLRRGVEFDLNERRLTLKIDDEKFYCECRTPEEETKIWDCTKTRPSSNGEHKKGNTAEIQLNRNGNTEIRYSQVNKPYIEYICIDGQWSRDSMKTYIGMQLAKRTNC